MGDPVTELIVRHWGLEALRDLIRSAEDVPGVFGVPRSELEAAWQAFVKDRCL